jgi:DNA-binding MarR family transcriptional regulator
MTTRFRLHDSLGYLVNQVASRMKLALEQELVKYGVTAQQWAAMALLGEVGIASVATIADQLGVDLGATSRLLTRLEEKKLIQRIQNANDRRALDVCLTARGEKLLPQLVRCAERVLSRARKPLTKGEENELRRLLEQVLSRF